MFSDLHTMEQEQDNATFPSSSAYSPSWKRPDEVMKLHRLKQKKKALQARMNRTSLPRTQDFTGTSSKRQTFESLEESDKRKNPFRYHPTKRPRCDIEDFRSIDPELSSDNTLFQLLNINSNSESSIDNLHTSFTSVLSQISGNNEVSNAETENLPKGENCIPVDWSLKTKARFMSTKPFACSSKLRTCEEASGITGFVRCVDTGLETNEDSCVARSLDTSPNARFHQCCLYWQHPALPWFELFPRTAARVSSPATSMIASSQSLRDSLHREWGESFRSLFQLTRARQCPYFYVCANTFTCLFRAAGILGFTEIHALLSPTTRGFRQMLKDEDVVYRMPLRKTAQLIKRLSSESASDPGYETVDSLDEQSQMQTSNVALSGQNITDIDGGLDEDEDEPPDEWLESMGVAAEEIRKIRSKQVKIENDKEKEVDRTPESLIYVEGVEAQALFNFLMNCKSSIATTGPLAGVPPTLISPVAFTGATLKSLKVRQSKVKVDMETYHSIELRGPLLPHAVHNMCSFLEQSLDEYSATFANLDSTRAFSLVTDIPVDNLETESPGDTKYQEETSNCSSSVRTPTKSHITSVFGKENLSDCGLRPSVLERFCCSDSDRVHLVDSLKFNVDSTYSWS